VRLEHGVQDALDERDLVGRVRRRELRRRVRRRVDECVQLRAVVLRARAADLEVHGAEARVQGCEVGGEVRGGYVVCEGGAAVCAGWFSAGEWRGEGKGEGGVPWTERMAARMGLISSKVRTERARKACRKARWPLLYASSSSAMVWIVGGAQEQDGNRRNT